MVETLVPVSAVGHEELVSSVKQIVAKIRTEHLKEALAQ